MFPTFLKFMHCLAFSSSILLSNMVAALTSACMHASGQWALFSTSCLVDFKIFWYPFFKKSCSPPMFLFLISGLRLMPAPYIRYLSEPDFIERQDKHLKSRIVSLVKLLNLAAISTIIKLEKCHNPFQYVSWVSISTLLLHLEYEALPYLIAGQYSLFTKSYCGSLTSIIGPFYFTMSVLSPSSSHFLLFLANRGEADTQF